MSKRSMSKGITLCEEIAHLFMKIDPEFSMKSMLCLCEIFKNEGMSIIDLSRLTGIPQSSLTSIVGGLADNRRSTNRTGYKLVEKRRAAWDKRNYQLYLTDEGHRLIKKLNKITSR
ncbi:MAG: hypothetical protein WBA74_07840 [Cyclobacteriaceae bacterium]